jgi:hypothetical protein
VRIGVLVIVALACVSLGAQEFRAGVDGAFKDGIYLRDAKAQDLLRSARIAIFGGPGGISRLKSVQFKGRSRFPADEGGMIEAAVNIRILLPDRYLRIDTGAFGKRIVGYSGNASLDAIESPDGKKKPDPRDAATMLRMDRAELARLMLGVATFASEEVPMQFQTRGTEREMPGPSDPLGVDATGDEGFTARIVFDGKSHLPLRIVFWGAERRVTTTTYEDRRASGGVKVPYKILTMTGDRIVDELIFNEIVVNPSLRKDDFRR